MTPGASRKYGMFRSVEERQAYDRDWYAKQDESYRVRRRANVRNRRNQIRADIAEYKRKHPCACGEADPVCLDFHHVESDKELNIADAIQRGWSLKHIMLEAEKCIVICANCHRKLHAGRGDPI